MTAAAAPVDLTKAAIADAQQPFSCWISIINGCSAAGRLSMASYQLSLSPWISQVQHQASAHFWIVEPLDNRVNRRAPGRVDAFHLQRS